MTGVGGARLAASACEPPSRGPAAVRPVVLHVRRRTGDADADAQALVAAGLTVLPGHTLAGLLETAARMSPDCTVVDAALMSLSNLSALTDPRLGRLPPIVLVGFPADSRLRARWLNAGVADCLSTPYSPEELAARVLGLLRREGSLHPPAASQLSAGEVTVDLDLHSVQVRGVAVSLTRTEFALLSYLVAHPDSVVTRDRLMAEVWGYTFGGRETVTVHIRRLRKKIERDPSRPELIMTVWGVGGYCFASAPPSALQTAGRGLS